MLLAALTQPSQAAVSINLPLDDPAYALFDKLVSRGLTFRNALTVKPITRLYAAHLLADILRQRRQEWEDSKRPDRFLDETLQHLADRFKRELRQLGAFYQPRRPDPVFWAPLHTAKLDLVAAHQPFLYRQPQSVFSPQERHITHRDHETLRLRTISWGTFWHALAAYVEPELIVRSDPWFEADTLEASLHQGYLKIGTTDLEFAFGRDTLWWGPTATGVIPRPAPASTLDLLKFSHPFPFRLPGVFRHLGAWQVAAFAAHYRRARSGPHAMHGGLRVTLQPTPYLQAGYTHLVPATDHHPNRPFAFDVVLSLPFLRARSFLHGANLYWQGQSDGGHIMGSFIDGGRWDLRFEYAKTHPGEMLYPSGRGVKREFANLFIGNTGKRESYRGQVRYYVAPNLWIATDSQYERYGSNAAAGVTSHHHIGLELSYPLIWRKRALQLGGRFSYAGLETAPSGLQPALYFYLNIDVKFGVRRR